MMVEIGEEQTQQRLLGWDRQLAEEELVTMMKMPRMLAVLLLVLRQGFGICPDFHRMKAEARPGQKRD
jgi:hypothetical protein